MADKRRIDDLGRIVIPRYMRLQLGIEEEEELEIEIVDDHIEIRKVED